MKQEVEKWRPFGHPEVIFVIYHFLMLIRLSTFSIRGQRAFRVSLLGYLLSSLLHKDYEHQTNEEKQSLMYHTPKNLVPSASTVIT